MDPLARDLAAVGAKLISTQQQPTKPAEDPRSPKFHKENAVVGVTLNDYTDREPSEDGTYVKVTVHRERIELIEQPPTAEELAAQKEQQKMTFKISAAVAAGIAGLLGVVAVLDRKQQRKVEVRTDAR